MRIDSICSKYAYELSPLFKLKYYGKGKNTETHMHLDSSTQTYAPRFHN